MSCIRNVRAARLAAAFAALLLAGGLTACSGSNQDAMSSGTDSSQSKAGGTQAPGGVAADGPAGGEDSSGSVNRTTVRTKAMIRTGQVAVTSEHPARTRAEVDRLLFAFGGSIDSEQTSNDADGDIERSTLVLRVPVTKFKAAVEALEKLGKNKSSDTRSKDVTTQVIDVDERVETLQNSLDRLQAYQSKAVDVDDLLRYEDQITQRQSELQSLQAQQAYLADQTAMSTITLYLSTPEKYVAPPDALANAGFLTGLTKGWNALVDFVVVALTVMGAALPFLVAIALVGVPTWLLVRRLTRRRAAPLEPPVDAAD